MKLLITATSLRPAYGGPATAVVRLASVLASKGADVTLWAADGSAMDPSLAAAGVHPAAGRVDDLVRAHRFDLVHDNGIWLRHNHHVSTLARKHGIPRIVSTHGMLSPWALRHKRWKKRVAWRVYQHRDLDSAASFHVATSAEALHLRKLRLEPPIVEIPNGMDIPDTSPFQPTPSTGERTALFLGRICPVKGLPMLVDAWQRLQPKGWHLRIAGPDEAGHRAEVEHAIAGAGLTGNIQCDGELLGRAKTQAFLAADLFILPSYSESFGMAIAEALAHGVPVICTTGAPWPQLIEHACGWRTEVCVEALTEALREATSRDPETLARMGQRGRTLIRDQFGWDQIARRMLDTYAGVVANPETRTSAQPTMAWFDAAIGQPPLTMAGLRAGHPTSSSKDVFHGDNG